MRAEIEIDSDTRNEPGTPPLTDTTFARADGECDAFVADMTSVAVTEGGKLVPNPNVMGVRLCAVAEGNAAHPFGDKHGVRSAGRLAVRSRASPPSGHFRCAAENRRRGPARPNEWTSDSWMKSAATVIFDVNPRAAPHDRRATEAADDSDRGVRAP